MNKLQSNQNQSTLSFLPIFYALLTIPTQIPSVVADDPISKNPDVPSFQPYTWTGHSSTYQTSSSFGSTETSNFEMTLTDFYTSLAAKQEPLGAEFEKILYDHLWSLYQN